MQFVQATNFNLGWSCFMEIQLELPISRTGKRIGIYNQSDHSNFCGTLHYTVPEKYQGTIQDGQKVMFIGITRRCKDETRYCLATSVESFSD